MCLGLHVMQSDPSIYFTLVPVTPCVTISALPAENRRYTLKHLISAVIWDTGYHLFISQHEIRTKTHEGLSETAVMNCLVWAWSPARNSLNSQWLQGTKLTPMCWVFEVLALESAQRVRCHTALQNPHMPPRSKVDQEKKHRPIPDGAGNIQHFVIYPLQLKFGNVSLCCVRFFLGGALNMLNTAGRLRMLGMFPDWALLVWVRLYLLPSRTQKWLKIIETYKAGKRGDRAMSYSSRRIKEEVRVAPHEDSSCLFHNAALR